MPSIYIAGPMRNYPLYNFPAFDEAAKMWRQLSYVVYNPAEHDRAMGFDEYADEFNPGNLDSIQWDLEKVVESDAIYLLPGWEHSVGAQAELCVARWTGSEVYWDPDAMPAEFNSICEEAEYLVNGPRQTTYSHPALDFSRTALIWEAILGVQVTPEQVALCMIGVKISRLVHSPDHRDSLVDVAGYAATYEKVREWRTSQD